MNNATMGKIIKCIAVLIDVIVPLIATISQFPIWVEQSGEATMSGIFLMLAFFSCLPFVKQIKEYMKSPSVLVLWLSFFLLLTLLKNIINQMVVVCFAGLIANAIGTVIYKIGDSISREEDDT